MNVYFFDFKEGFLHITDLSGYDHILFLLALCAIYQLSDGNKVLLPITAFALAHTTTLALAAFGIFRLPPPVVEFLIPVTILATCLYNYSYDPPRYPKRDKPNGPRSVAAFTFGLIHGLGFSSYFAHITGTDASTDSVGTIFAHLALFTLGIETGQVVIVGVVLLTAFLLVSGFGMKEREWNLTLSAGAGFLSFTMAVERLGPAWTALFG